MRTLEVLIVLEEGRAWVLLLLHTVAWYHQLRLHLRLVGGMKRALCHLW